MKYINQAVELKRDIMEEDARGDLADDVRIERKMKELAIITEAAHAQLQAYMSQKATVTTAAT